jgi:hypothetical protein
MFLDQDMNEKRIAGCINISLGSESYVNQLFILAFHVNVKNCRERVEIKEDCVVK